MMYAIAYDCKGSTHTCFTFDKDDAVTTFVSMRDYIKYIPGANNLVGGYWTVDVRLGNRLYTYFCDYEEVDEGDMVIVPTPDGDEHVRVERVAIRSRKELEAKCPFGRYKAIRKVVKDWVYTF